MLKSLFFPLILLVASIAMAQEDKTIREAQQEIIALLSGEQILEDGKRIEHRSTKQERQWTRECLSEVFSSMSLKPVLQEYRRPNVNPMVDLLMSPFKGANIYTILPATVKSNDYLVLGAHFDSERNCPGAIDNGSGIAIGYGVLRKLAQVSERNTNVILVYFDQEEEDLVGSQAFARKLKSSDYNILSVHTLDTMGWDRDGDKAVELESPTDDLLQAYAVVGERMNIPVYLTKVTSTDHHSFRELGFNATGLTDELVNGDYAPYKDTPKDTYETVNFDYISSCTELIYEVFKELMH